MGGLLVKYICENVSARVYTSNRFRKKPFDLQSRRIYKIDFVKKFATRDKTR